MRRSNFDLSTGLVAIGAIAVLVSLFLDWYQPGLSAWDVFEITDWMLVALAAGALVVIGTDALGDGGSSSRLAWICGLLAFVVVAQLLDPPPAARGADRDVGAWIALGGSVLMVAGAVLALAQISVTIDVAERERRRRTRAVDARGDEDDDERSGRGGLAGLWQSPSTSSSPSAPASPSAGGRAPGESPPAPKSAPPRGATAGGSDVSPSPDPDRTQPMQAIDPSDADR